MRKTVFLILAATLVTPLHAQDSLPGKALEGMWSDPPPTIEGMFCFGQCTDGGLEILYDLLDDPANDDTPLMELVQKAKMAWTQKEIVPLLTDYSRPSFPLDQAKSPIFLKCAKPGFSQQIFQPHQFQVSVFADRIEFHYGEYDARRTIWMDGRTPPPDTPRTLLGFSTGHMEGDVLVVETTHLSKWDMFGMFHGSDQLWAEERYSLSTDKDSGTRVLTMYATMNDPVALSAPVTQKSVRYWAPNETIDPYKNCEIPKDYIEHLGDEK